MTPPGFIVAANPGSDSEESARLPCSGELSSRSIFRHTGWVGGIKNKVKELRSVCFVQAAFLPGSDSSSLDADAHEVGKDAHVW